MSSVSTEVIDISKLESAKPLEVEFQPYQNVLAKWQDRVSTLAVTDITQKTEMQQARLARLELKEARVALDKTRLSLVAGLKEKTTKIDGAARVMREKFEELEASLLESEQFAERHAARQKAELKLKREREIQPFLDRPVFGDLSDLDASTYAAMLADAKTLQQAKLDNARKQEEERKAKEEADKNERKRLAEENARLQKEREFIEAKAKADQDRASKEAAEMKAKLDASAKEEAARKAKEEAERAARVKAERKAAAAPDRSKLEALVVAIRDFHTPSLKNTKIETAIDDEFTKLADFVLAKMEEL